MKKFLRHQSQERGDNVLLEFIQYIEEAITHIEHPEDLVFAEGSRGAQRGLQSLNSVIAQPKNVTIKWDGFPALVFGRNVDGQLIVVDKHMFTKKDGTGRQVTSLEQFIAYDEARGVNRGDLYKKLAVLWPGFEQAVPAGMQGYYWGDLLWAGRPATQNGEYVFQPNTVAYHVPINSELGKRIGTSSGGIVIHQFFSDFDSPPQVISGTGDLNLKGPLAIMTPNMTDKVVLKSPVQLIKRAESAVKTYGAAVDELINPINLSSLKITDLPGLMKTYVNARIRGENKTFYEWLPSKLSAPKMKRLFGDNQDGYLFQNDAGVQGAFAIYETIAAAKNNVVQQLDTQQKTIKGTINNTPGGEGYVVSTPGGLIKLVNRAQFSAANFAKNM